MREYERLALRDLLRGLVIGEAMWLGVLLGLFVASEILR